MTPACARALVRCAHQTRHVRRLFVGEYPARSVLPQWPHFSNLHVFQTGWTSNEEYGDSCHFQCHLWGLNTVALVRRMPRLEELYVFASEYDAGPLFDLETLKNLRVLQLYHSHELPLWKLANNPAFSRLTHLLIHPKAAGVWGRAPYIEHHDFSSILFSPHLRSLTHLRLRLTDIGDQGCEQIVRSGILKRLKVLDLRHGSVGDEGARILAACPDLKHLELLDLSRNELTAEGIAALQAVGIGLRVEYQHGPTRDSQNKQYLLEGDYE